jgi:glucosamine 6-phosphate synthetase-like amidotransferase/phosphosugar isomerase protein
LCNINFVCRKDKLIDPKLTEYINHASFVSYDKNSDGDGYFAVGKKLSHKKSQDKLLYDLKSWLICSHQRYATSGDDEQDVHPYDTKDFVLVHNGVFSGLGNKGKSDTREFVEMLESNYESCKKDIVKAIQETTKEVTGSFSVFVYHKPTKKLYYFKESSTGMYLLENSKYLVMSTIQDNVEYAQHLLGIKGKIMTIEPNEIYEVLNDFEGVGAFEKKQIIYKKPEQSWWSGYSTPDKTFKEHLKHNEEPCDRRKKVCNLYEEIWENEEERYLMEIDSPQRYDDEDWRHKSVDEQLEDEGYVRYM